MSAHEPVNPADFAFYYPGHLWYRPGWVKNLLLFFDGIALLVPEYKKDEPERLDPELVGTLRDRGMLELLVADTVVDQDATRQLAEAMMKVVESGTLDKLATEQTAFHHLSYSRLGGFGDEKLADTLHTELMKRGLARERERGLAIPMHPTVRVLVLVLLSQILRAAGVKRHLELAPATDRPELVEALGELLAVPSAISPPKIVEFDLETVGVDLSNVPIGEVLAFRSEQFDAHRTYARKVRDFARELSLLPDGDREKVFEDRQAEIRDIAARLKQQSRRAWRRPASFALSLAGAAWSLTSGNLVGGILSAAAAITSLKPADVAAGDAYSYLFSASARLP